MTATPATTRMFSESEYNAQVAKIRILEGKVRRLPGHRDRHI